jgi:hypothetical protein
LNKNRHLQSVPGNRRHFAVDGGDSAAFSSIFLRLSIFPVGRHPAARPSARLAPHSGVPHKERGAGRKPLGGHIRRKVIMEIPIGKCLNCGKMIKMWRCGDTTGGGTYHIECFECNQRDSRQSVQLTALWRWVGWICVTGFIIGTFFVVLVFGGI